MLNIIYESTNIDRIYIFLFHIDSNAPCVGLCFHNKQKALAEKESEDYSRGWPLNSKEFGPPCVGLCHMFREMNVPNPGYKYQHTGIAPPPPNS